jgi:myo-inositol 2-dehydrogenase/D-chiro-inositol 1-dehydrogenase
VARNTHYPDESRHDILGSAGTILLGNPPQPNMFLSSATHRRGVLAPELSLAMNDGYRMELASFVEYVRDGVLPTVDGHTSRAALRVALAARESLQTGMPVKINDYAAP